MRPKKREDFDESKAKLKLLRLKEEKLLRLSRKNPAIFSQYAFEEKNAPFHNDIQEKISEHKDILIEAPRGFGKTSQVIRRIIWELGRNPNLRIKYISQNDDKSSEKVSEMISHLLFNEKIKKVFPHLKFDREPSKHKFYLEREKISKDASVEAQGILSSAVGGRADILVFDDVCDLRNSVTQPSMRESVITAFQEVWTPILEPWGRRVYICTPWHLLDLTAFLKKQGVFEVVRYPCGGPPNFHSIWPERMSSKQLEQRYLESPRAYARAYQLKPMSEEETPFSEESLQNSLRAQEFPGVIHARCLGIDPGSSKRGKNFTCLFLMGLGEWKGEDYFVFEKVEKFRTTSPQVKSRILRLVKERSPQMIIIESNAYQRSLVEILQEERLSAEVLGLDTTPKALNDPTLGMAAMGEDIALGKFWVPIKDHFANCNCSFCLWRKDYLEYPIGTCDVLMASWLAWRGIKKYGKQPRIILL